MDETGQRRVYLPAGDWVDFWTKELVHGGRWITVQAPLEVLPLWVRAGSIIPMGPMQQYVDEKPLDPLTVELYAPGASGDFVIHDQGKPDIGIAYAQTGDTLTVTVDPTPGAVELVCYGPSVRAAWRGTGSLALEADANGASVARFDGRDGGTAIFTVRADGSERAA
jgi:alpha-D-xyloside xylohydrolase